MGKSCCKKPAAKRVQVRTKAKPAGIWPLPKKGKARALTRKPSSQTSGTTRTRTPYTRQRPSASTQARRISRDAKWMLTLEELVKSTDLHIIQKLRRIGWLKAVRICPQCDTYISTKGYRYSTSHQGRCRTRGCLERIPHVFRHPLFTSGHQCLSLRAQASSILMSLMKIGYDTQFRLQSEGHRTSAMRLGTRLRTHITEYVEAVDLG